MLTGDQPQAAAQVAAAPGIQEFRAAQLPQDKAAAVQAIQAEEGAAFLVGDGVNDAPALASAAVGIAMGAVGSDVALENADIALMNDKLGLLPFLIRLSRACVGKIRFNIALAIGVKVLVLGMAMAGWVGLEAAILSDVGVTVLVIFNGLGLLDFEGGA
jgi:Cd2+/Zn2+-exporting ATPase